MAATTAAAAGFEVAGFRDAAQLKTLADVLHDRLLDALHLVLSVEKSARNFIFQEGFADLFKIIDLGFFQLQPGVALLLEKFTLGDERVVLAADGVIGEENIDLLAQGLDFRLVQDGLAKFPGFLDDDRFFGLSLHKLLLPRADNPAPVFQYTTGSRKMQGRKGMAAMRLRVAY
jgi:hypothetical protein